MKSFRKLSFLLFALMFFISLIAFNSPTAHAFSQAWETIGSDSISNDYINSLKMALDSHDTPYVAYGDTSQNGRLVKFDGTDWVTLGDTFKINNDNNSLALKIDSHDIPYVAYVFCGTLTVMKYTNSAWVHLPDISVGRYVGLALDSHDTPYVVYRSGDYQTFSVKKFDGSNWIDVGNGGFNGQGVSNVCIAFDKNDVPYVAYEYSTAPMAVTVYRFDGINWQSLGDVGPTGGLYEVNLAVDGVGTPYVSFWNGSASYLYSFKDTVWQKCGEFGSCLNAGFAIDSLNYPYLAYLSNSSTGQLKKYDYQQNTWEDVGLISPSRIDMISVAVDSQDQPYVACKDTANGYHPRLYAYRTHYSLKYTAGMNGSLSGTPAQDVMKGKSGTAVTAVPDDNYHFVKWSDNNTSASRTDTNVQNDKDLTATFAIDTHTVQFKSQGGSKVDDKTADYNTAITQPEPDRTGYTFAGWYKTKECDDPSPVTFPYTVTEDTTLYAKWTPITYNVKYDANYGNPSSTKDDKKIFTYDVPAALETNSFTRTGFKFAGWALTEDGDVKYTDGASVENLTASDKSTVTLYANWSANYTVKFSVGSGGKVSPTSKQVTYGEQYGTLPVPTKTDYYFYGWYTGANGSGKLIESDDTVDITNNTTLYAKWVKDSSSTVALTAPSVTSITAADYKTITLSWKKVTNAARYLVYQSIGDSKHFKQITDTDKLSCAYTELKTGTKYYYKVKAYWTPYQTKEYSSYSSVKSVTPVWPTISFSVSTPMYTSVDIKWNAVAGATKYELLRCDTSYKGEYKIIASRMPTDDLSFADTGLTCGHTYYYKIKVYGDPDSTYSTQSVYKSIKPAWPKINLTAAMNNYYSISLNWNSVNAADCYNVYRSTSSKGVYNMIAERVYGTSYVDQDKALAVSKTYYYEIRPVDVEAGDAGVGPYCSYKSAKLTWPTINLNAASNGYNSVKLTWNEILQSEEDYYEIYRSISSKTKYVDYTYIGFIHKGSETNVSFIDEGSDIGGLMPGKTYYYTILPNVKIGTTDDVKWGLYCSYKSAKPVPSAPAGLTLAPTSGVPKSITVTWGTVDGATGYEIYRATSKNGTYIKIKTTVDMSYADTGRTVGKTYYYKVRAFVGNTKVYGSYSEIKSLRL